MSQYFPQTFGSYQDVKFDINLSNLAIKPNLEKATGIDKSSFAKK